MKIKVKFVDNINTIQRATEQKSCFILATNIDKKSIIPEEILKRNISSKETSYY